LTLVQKNKLPYFISDENTQQGVSFGDKLRSPFNPFWIEGYDKVIVMGNDSQDCVYHLQALWNCRIKVLYLALILKAVPLDGDFKRFIL
jgi:hypothetical protein